MAKIERWNEESIPAFLEKKWDIEKYLIVHFQIVDIILKSLKKEKIIWLWLHLTKQRKDKRSILSNKIIQLLLIMKLFH